MCVENRFFLSKEIMEKIRSFLMPFSTAIGYSFPNASIYVIDDHDQFYMFVNGVGGAVNTPIKSVAWTLAGTSSASLFLIATIAFLDYALRYQRGDFKKQIDFDPKKTYIRFGLNFAAVLAAAEKTTVSGFDFYKALNKGFKTFDIAPALADQIAIPVALTASPFILYSQFANLSTGKFTKDLILNTIPAICESALIGAATGMIAEYSHYPDSINLGIMTSLSVAVLELLVLSKKERSLLTSLLPAKVHDFSFSSKKKQLPLYLAAAVTTLSNTAIYYLDGHALLLVLFPNYANLSLTSKIMINGTFYLKLIALTLMSFLSYLKYNMILDDPDNNSAVTRLNNKTFFGFFNTVAKSLASLVKAEIGWHSLFKFLRLLCPSVIPNIPLIALSAIVTIFNIRAQFVNLAIGTHPPEFLNQALLSIMEAVLLGAITYGSCYLLGEERDFEYGIDAFCMMLLTSLIYLGYFFTAMSSDLCLSLYNCFSQDKQAAILFDSGNQHSFWPSWCCWSNENNTSSSNRYQGFIQRERIPLSRKVKSVASYYNTMNPTNELPLYTV